MQTHKQRIKVPIFLPLSLAILILLGSSILGGYILQRRNLLSEVRMHVNGTHLLFEKYLNEDARLMGGIIDFIKKDKNLQKLWLEKNRNELLDYSSPIFQEIRSKYEVTHFYFHGPDQACFLRVHNPPRHGDVINRFTMKSASDKKNPTWGIELGPLGTFTLRVVHPWLIDGKLTGYIELGEEIEHILPVMKEFFDVELFVVLDKSFLNQAGWEEGMRMMGRNGDWDFLSEEVIADYTLEDLSEESLQSVKDILGRRHTSLPGATINRRNYRCGFFHLVDAGEREIGYVVVMKDITSTEKALRTFSIVLACICITVGLVLCVLFYMYIRTIESKLTNVYTNLQGEIKKRRQAEGELQLAYNQMEVKVKERTSELRSEVTERKKAEEILQKVNTELETTIEKLKSANRELEQFAFITSHHLREPVRKILTFANVLTNSLKDKLNDDEFENLMYMTDGANKIAQMVQGLKLYLHASKDKTEFEYIDLNSILEHLEKQELTDKLEQSNGTISVLETLPIIKGSSTQISQVLQHIIENSIKFRKETVPLEIVVKAFEEKNEMVRVEIEDNGVGIKEEYLKDIFNPFKLLNTERANDGVGIGLTICKKTIEKHGGQMGVKSVHGHGTTVWVTLPLTPHDSSHRKKVSTKSIASD